MIDLLKLILSVLAWLFKSRALGASVRASRALLRSLAPGAAAQLGGGRPIQAGRLFAAAQPPSRRSRRGLTTALFGPAECCIKSGALYVYHREALAGLSVNPDRFCGSHRKRLVREGPRLISDHRGRLR